MQGLGTAMRCVAALRRAPGDPARLREIAAAAAANAGPVAAAPARIRIRRRGWMAERGRGQVPARAQRDPRARPAAGRGLRRRRRARGTLGYPVALKLSSPSIQHKSDIGAVALGVSDAEMLVAEAERMLALPEAAGADLLVEEMCASPGSS